MKFIVKDFCGTSWRIREIEMTSGGVGSNPGGRLRRDERAGLLIAEDIKFEI